MPPEIETEVETEVPEVSIRDSLLSAFNEQEGATEQEEKPGRVRGPDGKFARADASDPIPPEASGDADQIGRAHV